MFWKKKPHSGPAPGQPVYRCSFCHKSQRDVRTLIAGPEVYICNECVDICLDVVSEKRKDDSVEPEPHDWMRSSTRLCALCRLPVTVAEALVVENRGLICAGCLGEIKAAIAREELPGMR